MHFSRPFLAWVSKRAPFKLTPLSVLSFWLNLFCFFRRGNRKNCRPALSLLYRAVECFRFSIGVGIDIWHFDGGCDDWFADIAHITSCRSCVSHWSNTSADQSGKGYSKAIVCIGRIVTGSIQHWCIACIDYIHLCYSRHVTVRPCSFARRPRWLGELSDVWSQYAITVSIDDIGRLERCTRVADDTTTRLWSILQ